MARMSKEVMEVFNDPSSAKVLATAGSTALEVNAVPKGSLRVMHRGTDLSYLSKLRVVPIISLWQEDRDWMPLGLCTM